MAEDPGGLPLQHARVLPSFAATFVNRPIKYGGHTITQQMLLAWPGPVPGKHTANAVRSAFVKSKRPQFEKVWQAKINVRLVEGWADVLHRFELERLVGFLDAMTSTQTFAELTFREFKQGLRLPVEACLCILAKLEALYWEPSMAFAAKVGKVPQVDLVHREVSDGWRQAVQIALASSWVKELHPEDLRFPSPAGEPLESWLRERLQRELLPATVLELGDLIVLADKCDWRSELELIARACLMVSKKRPGSAAANQRWTDIFLCRFSGPNGRTLQEVGDIFELTRERVRQICDQVIQVLSREAVAMPALDKLLQAAARIAPVTLEEADEQLVKLIGPNAGVGAALDFCEQIGRKAPARSAFARSRTNAAGGYDRIAFVHAGDEAPSWVQKAMAQAHKECRVVGCTNYLRIAGHMALVEGVLVGQESLQSMFEALPGYRDLDRTAGWFSIPGGYECAIAKRLRKLFSVADASLDIDTIVTMLITDDRWIREDGKALAVPPVHVMAELLAGWSWLRGDGHNKFSCLEPISMQEALTELERTAVQVMQLHDGVATRTDLFKVIVQERGYSNVTLSLSLATSPIFRKIEHSIYSINGRSLSAQGLSNARVRRASEHGDGQGPLSLDVTAPFTVLLKQTGSTRDDVRKMVYLPAAYSPYVRGRFNHSRGTLPSIKVSDNLQIYSLGGIAHSLGIGPRQQFVVTFDIAAQTYDIELNVAAD